MATRLTARDICGDALKKMGYWSINEDSVEERVMLRALAGLDHVMGSFSGEEELTWLVHDQVRIDLDASVGTYDLTAKIAAAGYAVDLAFVYAAKLVDSLGNEEPIGIYRRDAFEELGDDNDEGTPVAIVIDRQPLSIMRTYPILPVTGTGYQMELTFSTMTPDFRDSKAAIATGLRETWQMWAVYAVAAYCGDGSVRRIPDNELADYRNQAEIIRSRLLRYDNRQQESTEPDMGFYDGVG